MYLDAVRILIRREFPLPMITEATGNLVFLNSMFIPWTNKGIVLYVFFFLSWRLVYKFRKENDYDNKPQQSAGNSLVIAREASAAMVT